VIWRAAVAEQQTVAFHQTVAGIADVARDVWWGQPGSSGYQGVSIMFTILRASRLTASVSAVASD
jgi:hypothetical protein